MQLDAEVCALLLESVYGVWDGGEIAGGKGEMIVVVGIVGEVGEGIGGAKRAAEGKELDGCFVEVFEMEVSDREHLRGAVTDKERR